jgi:lactate permease
MTALLAFLPILIVLLLMLVFRLGSHLAGLAGWVIGLLVAFFAFGLNWQVFWVSQGKGLLLTLNVLLVLLPALLLYNLVDQMGGIRAIALAFQGRIHNQGWLLILQAWMLTALIESLAGFGMPMAIVAPMMIALGVSPVIALAASAVGHTWAVSMGGMALPFRTLSEVTKVTQVSLFPITALLLGIAAVTTGLAVAFLLKQGREWWRVLLLGLIVAGVQAGCGLIGLIPISSFIAAGAGLFIGTLISDRPKGWKPKFSSSPALRGGLFAYGLLISLIMLVSLVRPLNQTLSAVTWTLQFPQVLSNNGFSTPAGSGYVFHFLIHPGTLVLISILASLFIFRNSRVMVTPNVPKAIKETIRSALPACMGTLFMIGLSTVMEHTGMTLALAKEMSAIAGSVYPIIAPVVGMLGAFATGSNTNSNVLFGMLQKEVSTLIGVSPIVILAAQTAGGSLGSMIAPAKLAVGSSTNSLKGREGEVLRYTLPIALAIALLIGLVAWLLK